MNERRVYRIEALLDTGFSDFIALPASDIATFGLPPDGKLDLVLADGTSVQFKLYLATVHWCGQVYTIRVAASNSESLVGVKLLEGLKVCIPVRPGEEIDIVPIP